MVSEKPPPVKWYERIQPMAGYNNFVMCSSVSPIYVHRFLFWFPPETKGCVCSGRPNRSHHAGHMDILVHD